MPKKKRIRIVFQGAVQGVGFRPHIYRLAKAHQLAGWVKNDPAGVIVEVEGEGKNLERFFREAISRPPVLARIKKASRTELPEAGYKNFVIRKSGRSQAVSTQVSADAATCPDCLKELFNPNDRRYRYPFINCTNCGPRFTIIERIPYDRPFTTMKTFKMCPECRAEYDDPASRRFHAQPNACPVCGPKLSLFDRRGKKIPGDPISAAVKFLQKGKIIAVKSLGGFQLACDALNEKAVAELRRRKLREDKPFAMMALDLRTIKKFAAVSRAEQEMLLSPERPIVLLSRKQNSKVAASVAPRQRNLGFMLPYTPLHHLLLRESRMLLVMTSGNLSDEPIAFEDQEAGTRLRRIADFFLTHNRPIFIRCDDSVMRVFKGQPYPLRRARGYVPRPLELVFPEKRSLLAVGGHMKNTFALARAGQVIVSHHIGDLENLETLRAFEQGIRHFQSIFEIEPEMAVHDLHPDYLSTRYALKLPIPKLAVQHHHAHAASVMAEHGLTRKVIAVSLDGTGYGTDGCIWGGEFLLADYFGFERKAHLQYLPLPGGDKAVEENWRMALSWLHRIYGQDMWKLKIDFLRGLKRDQAELVLKAVDQGLNAPLTSSMGRLFDAVSAILGIRLFANYEGQPAIELEMSAEQSESGAYKFNYREEDAKIIIEAEPVLIGIVEDMLKQKSHGKIAARFHNAVCRMTVEVCSRLREETGLNDITLSGGVFQNWRILTGVQELLLKSGFRVFTHRLVPCNDGGISLGQAAIGLRRMKDVLGSSHARS